MQEIMPDLGCPREARREIFVARKTALAFFGLKI